MRVERRIPSTPEKLWQLLIRDATLTDDGVMLPAGKVARYESRALLECRGDATLLRWHLTPLGDDRTLLVFTQEPIRSETT